MQTALRGGGGQTVHCDTADGENAGLGGSGALDNPYIYRVQQNNKLKRFDLLPHAATVAAAVPPALLSNS